MNRRISCLSLVLAVAYFACAGGTSGTPAPDPSANDVGSEVDLPLEVLDEPHPVDMIEDSSVPDSVGETVCETCSDALDLPMGEAVPVELDLPDGSDLVDIPDPADVPDLVDATPECPCTADGVDDSADEADTGCTCRPDVEPIDANHADEGLEPVPESIPDVVLIPDESTEPGVDEIVDPCATAGQPCFASAGTCRTEGVEICKTDGSGTECNAPAIQLGQDDECNGKDEDCDGIADSHYVPTTTSCGTGECASSGLLLCVDGSPVDTCEPGSTTTEICDGKDNDCNGLADDISSATTKRVVLNCYADASHQTPLPVADCWNLLSPDAGQTPPATMDIGVQFIDARTPCDKSAGMNLCLSSAITTCTDATLFDGCVSSISFDILIIGTQYRYKSPDGNVSFGFDKTTSPRVAAMQVLHVPPSASPGCTILYNTFSCPSCN